MPKLLDVIKERGLTHQEVIDLIDSTAILRDKEAGLPESQEDEKEVPIEEPQEDDKPIELYVTDQKDEDTEVIEEEVEDKETIELTPEELDKRIEVALAERLKSTRKIPSKGKIVEKPQSAIEVIKKNWFEEIV